MTYLAFVRRAWGATGFRTRKIAMIFKGKAELAYTKAVVCAAVRA